MDQPNTEVGPNQWIEIDPTSAMAQVASPILPPEDCPINQLREWIEIKSLQDLISRYGASDTLTLKHYIRLCEHYMRSYYASN